MKRILSSFFVCAFFYFAAAQANASDLKEQIAEFTGVSIERRKNLNDNLARVKLLQPYDITYPGDPISISEDAVFALARGLKALDPEDREPYIIDIAKSADPAVARKTLMYLRRLGGDPMRYEINSTLAALDCEGLEPLL